MKLYVRDKYGFEPTKWGKKGKGHPSTLTVTTETILKSGYTVIIHLL